MKTRKFKIIVDTNLWISYLITKGNERLDKLILSDKGIFIFSHELINEFIEVAQRPKFNKYFNKNDIAQILDLFGIYGDLIKVKSEVRICRDVKDNFLLSLAKDSSADFLITGDCDLLDLKKFGKTIILTISELDDYFINIE